MKQIQLQINGLDCSACIIAIDDMLESIDGVIEAKTSYAKQLSKINFNPQKVSQEKLLQTMRKAGYDVALLTQ